MSPEMVHNATRFTPRPFRPAWWAPGPHLQTIVGRYGRPRIDFPLSRERWETPDGDFLDVDFAPEPSGSGGDSERRAPVVLVLHGLEGGSRRAYALLAYRELALRGVRAVGLNFRSCSGVPNRLARAYHSGDTGDLAFVLGKLKQRFPDRRFGALGFSLGGNVLLKLLGEQGAAAPVDAAVAVSVPYDLAAGALCLEETLMGRVYAHFFLRSLRMKMRWKSDILRGSIALDDALAAPTIREFDELATAPLHGFRDAAHYYQESSSARFLERVATPTLLIHALDDPFLPQAFMPLEAIHANPALIPALVERGGHLGFVEGSPGSLCFWAEEQAARFLAAALGTGAQA